MARTRAAQSRIALSKPKTGTKRKRDEGPEDEVPEPEMPPRRSARFGKPETRDCDICAESKVVYRDFPSLSSCNHDPTVCIECFGKQFVIKVESNQNDGWAACTCPLCNEAVGPNEAQTIVPTTVFREINKMIQKAKQQTFHNWIWCPAPDCGHGQLHRLTENPSVSCDRCKAEICFTHRVLWHAGVTCQEYDEMGDHDETVRKNMAEIKRTTKPCPFCKTRIKKEGGCDYMICGRCRRGWIWSDVPFDGESRGNSAEFVGGPQVTRPPAPQVRAAIDQVIQFENARVDTARATEVVGDLLGFVWNRGVRADQQLAQRNAPVRPQQAAVQQEQRPGGMFAGMFNAVRNFINPPNNPPTRVTRAVQTARLVPTHPGRLVAPRAMLGSPARPRRLAQQNARNEPRVTRSQTARGARRARRT